MNGQFFKFPLTSEGLEWFSSIDQMREKYLKMFEKLYGDNKEIKPFQVSVNFNNSLAKICQKLTIKFKRKVVQRWIIICKICTHQIQYCMFQKSQGFHLTKMDYYHIHTDNRERYMKYMSHNQNFTQTLSDYFISVKQGKKETFTERTREDELIDFISSMHSGIRMIKDSTKFLIMKRNFGITQLEFNELMKKFNQNFDSSFEQLLQKLNLDNSSYRVLPKTLLNRQKQDTNPSDQKLHILEEQMDSNNPSLPNILLIVTPAMKSHYQQFGSFVGFDLTFSLIRERTVNNSEYMVGCFIGTTQSRRIISFGLVITNSQSVFAYSWIFREFFQIMGKAPSVMVTDEEKAMFLALEKLKQQGIFKGQHLLDVFHLLRKFRKGGSSGEMFQLIRQMIHAKDKLTYRQLFKKAIKLISNDHQKDLLRTFDLQSQKYCFSQINPAYVGKGVSNSPNQYFHSHIKQQIPYAITYTKAVQKILSIIQLREPLVKIPLLIPYSFDQIMNVEHMKTIKKTISDRAFRQIMKEAGKSVVQHILPLREVSKRNLQANKEDFQTNSLYVEDEGKIYMVKKEKSMENFNEDKWSCLCEFSEKSGHLCSHISKVLIRDGINFSDHIDKRWKVSLEILQNPALKAFKTTMRQKTLDKMYIGDSEKKNQKQIDPLDEQLKKYRIQFFKDQRQWSQSQKIQYINFVFHKMHLFQNLPLSDDLFANMSSYFINKTESQCKKHHNMMLKKYDSVEKMIEYNQGLIRPSLVPLKNKNSNSCRATNKQKHEMIDEEDEGSLNGEHISLDVESLDRQ